MSGVDKTGWVVGTVLAKQGRALHDKSFMQFEDQPPYTFGAMDASANRIANFLASHGVQRGDHVLVMVPNSMEFLQAWFGISRLGAVFIPINTAYKGAFLEHVINNAAGRLMLIDRQYAPLLQAIETRLPQLDTAVIVDTAGAEATLPTFQRLRALAFHHLLQAPATPMQVPVTY